MSVMRVSGKMWVKNAIGAECSGAFSLAERRAEGVCWRVGNENAK